MSGQLENIRVFMRAVELGSFSEAGRVLRLSSAVASYRIKVLEEHLGCRLITRTTRRMNVTEAGRLFYERCIEVMEALDRAESSVSDSGGAPRRILKITAPLGLGRTVIASCVGDYQKRHKETEIRLRLSDHLLDLVQEGVDIAVRMSNLEDSSFTVRKIADIERVICGAPSYIERAGAPETLDDLLKHDCLLLRFPGSRQFRWPLGRGRSPVSLSVSGPLDADDGDVLTHWALSGNGFVLKPLFEVAHHIAAGKLVPVLEKYPPQNVTMAILYPTRRMFPRRVHDLVDDLYRDTRKHIVTQLNFLDKRLPP